MKVVYGKKKFDIEAKKVSLLSTGLMFRSRDTSNLLFEFKHDKRIAITSLFVYFPFLALWLDKNNKVLEWIIVTPFTSTISPKKHFRKLLEIPMNTDNEHIFRIFVGGKKDLNIT